MLADLCGYVAETPLTWSMDLEPLIWTAFFLPALSLLVKRVGPEIEEK